MIEPESLFIKIRGANLRYVDWGDNGPPLLLFHGDMRTGRSFDAVARELCQEFHVMSLDARGHGDSDWTPRGYRWDERTEDLADFCKELGLRDAIGAAHSSGGVVMALCAEKYPGIFNRLILMEPMVVVDEKFQKMVAQRVDYPRTTWESREEIYDYLKAHQAAGRWRDDVIRDVVAHEAYQREDGLFDMKWSPHSFNWADRDGDFVDLKPVFRNLGLPILLIRSSDHNPRSKEQHAAPDDIPNFHTLTIQKASHNMYMERPDAISRAVTAFVEGQELPDSI